MPYNKELADKIIQFAKLEPYTPSGKAHDMRSDEFDQMDFADTAKQLISTGQIKARLQEDYSGLFLAFRN